MGLCRLAVFVSSVLSLFHICHAGKSKAPAINPLRFLIVSAPREAKVSYVRINHGGITNQGHKAQGTATKVLIDKGLVHPQGLAVEQKWKQLLVADPDSKAIFAYPLNVQDEILTVGERKVCAEGTEARWVAVDAVGNIFFSDEPKNQILKITRYKALRGDTTPELVYDGASLSQVSSPGGIAIDSFHAYWVNKQVGTQVGSVVQAGEQPDAVSLQSSVMPLARNTDKSYGVCLALNNVFFTQPSSTIYGVKKSGSQVVSVSDELTNPRGCAWDGDGTVYVADRGANAVYSFAGNMQELGAAHLTKTVDVEDAFGVAVFSGACRQAFLATGVVLLVQVAGAAMAWTGM